MLQEFLGTNPAMITRCRSKAAIRHAPRATEHELRSLIGTATLAIATIKRGGVGLTGSLSGQRDLVDRTLVEVRLTAGIPERRERIDVADFIADVQVAAAMEAERRDLEFVVAPIEDGLAIEGDRQILAVALANILQNAIKFTRPRGRVGGLPTGKAEELFRPFEQLSVERTVTIDLSGTP